MSKVALSCLSIALVLCMATSSGQESQGSVEGKLSVCSEQHH